jgi:predicted transcriptional regulator
MKHKINVLLDDEGGIMIADSEQPAMHVREFIHCVLKNRGMTAARLQTMAGITHPMVSYYLSGRSESMRVGIRILNALGYDVNFVSEV